MYRVCLDRVYQGGQTLTLEKDTLVESLVNDGPNSMTLDQWFSKVSPISRVAEMPFHWSFSLGMEILRRLFADDLTLSRVRDFTFVSTYTRAAILKNQEFNSYSWKYKIYFLQT